MLLDSFVTYHARYRPTKAALLFREQAWSYKFFDEQINRCANAFAKLGISHGDRVAAFMENSPWFLIGLMTSARLGAIFVPCNYRLTGLETAEVLERAGASVLLAQARHFDRLPGSARTASNRVSITIDDARVGALGLAGLIEGADVSRPAVKVSSTDAVLLQYTSGTTGQPKGVLTHHAGWVQSCLIQAPLKRMFEHSVVMNAYPLCHTGGTKWFLEALSVGATTVLEPRFDVQQVLADMERYKVTNTGFVPTAFYQFLDAQVAQRRDLSALKYLNFGAAPNSERRLRQAIELLGCGLTQGYGMTELAGGSITCAVPDDYVRDGVITDKLSSAGRPMVDCEVRIVDDAGQEVKRGDTGELLVRTGRALIRYWGEPPETTPIDEQGFYHTGDLVREDEQGYLYIVDRKKDMIVSGGLNIYSKEVEDTILAHPAASEVYVVGMPDEHWGENVHAFVVLKEGASCTAEEIREWCQSRIASYKKPRVVTFVSAESLPRTALGKVPKRLLRDQWLSEKAPKP